MSMPDLPDASSNSCSLQESKLCYILALPNELFLMISKILSLKDRLALADSCAACRSLVSENDCLEACRNAGLSVIPNTSGRVMAKLLCRPRVGVCNWSLDGGEPKANLNFSKVWSTSPAIESALTVSLHPCFNPTKYYFLCETISFEEVDLRVAPEAPEIRLCEHSLYRHEYISSPPLQDLRVMIIEDEGPLAEVEESDLSFQIHAPTGVTLGHFYEALFRFLHQAPRADMYMVGVLKGAIRLNYREFLRSFPTVLTVLDYWRSNFDDEETSFSERGIAVELPLYGGHLVMKVHSSDGDTVRHPTFLEEFEIGTKWGEPRVEPENPYHQRAKAPCKDIKKPFWDLAPIFTF